MKLGNGHVHGQDFLLGDALCEVSWYVEIGDAKSGSASRSVNVCKHSQGSSPHLQTIPAGSCAAKQLKTLHISPQKTAASSWQLHNEWTKEDTSPLKSLNRTLKICPATAGEVLDTAHSRYSCSSTWSTQACFAFG